ncbi:MAG: sporulation protein YunB [Clostridia bacterium]|nr:sporulation protein YunB [Clostridia bacterium]
MSKIYSRKRFILKPRNKLVGESQRWPNSGSRKTFIIKRKTLKLLVVMVSAVIVYTSILSYIGPVFETLCEDKVKSISTIISNQESTKIMNKYQYEELYTIEKDEAGNVVIIKSNVVPINNMISDLTENIQNRFNEVENTQIEIPVGNLIGTYYFSGVGPSIPAKVRTSGTLDTEIKSEFIAKGINQTLHRIYVNFECYVKIITPIKNFEKKITNQVIIAEHVIVGNIPDSYYNLEGMGGVEDVLNVID